MRLEILATIVFFFCGSYLTGVCIRGVFQRKGIPVFECILSGVILWWAMMELILVPMTLMVAPFSSFVLIYSIAVGCICLTALFFYKDIWQDLSALKKGWKNDLTLGHMLAFGLMLYQLYFIHHHMYLEWDDNYYVNLANVALFSDKIYWVYPENGVYADFDRRYVLSLWPIFYAWLSKLIGVVPTIMAHTILPWIFIPLAYLIYVLIGKELFPEDRQLQGMFLAFAVLLHLFMSGEHTAGLTFLSITPWVGKGLWATVLMPALFYWILRILRDDIWQNWVMLGMTGLAGSLLSSMGIMLMPVFVGLILFVLSIYKRSAVFLLKGVASCIPCVLLGCAYIILQHVELF